MNIKGTDPKFEEKLRAEAEQQDIISQYRDEIVSIVKRLFKAGLENTESIVKKGEELILNFQVGKQVHYIPVTLLVKKLAIAAGKAAFENEANKERAALLNAVLASVVASGFNRNKYSAIAVNFGVTLSAVKDVAAAERKKMSNAKVVSDEAADMHVARVQDYCQLNAIDLADAKVADFGNDDFADLTAKQLAEAVKTAKRS